MVGKFWITVVNNYQAVGVYFDIGGINLKIVSKF